MAVPRTQHDAPGPELEPLQRSPGWTQVAGSPSALWCLPDPKALEEPDKPWRRASCGHTGLGPPLGVTGADLQPRLSPPVCTWRLPLIPGDRAPTACPPAGPGCGSLDGRGKDVRAERQAGLGGGTLGPQALPCSTRSCLPLTNTSPQVGSAREGAFGGTPGRPGAGCLTSSSA